MAAVAPLCHYGGGRFRPPTLFTFSNVTAPPMVQRLVGEFSPIFDLTIFFLFFSRQKGRPQRGSREQLYLEALEESGDQFTFIIVVSLAVCVTLLLLVIVVLMVYMCHKKEKQLKGGQLTASASSSQHKAPSEGIFILFFLVLYRVTRKKYCPTLTKLSLSDHFSVNF